MPYILRKLVLLLVNLPKQEAQTTLFIPPTEGGGGGRGQTGLGIKQDRPCRGHPRAFREGEVLWQFQNFRENFWIKFWISLYILYIFTSPSAQDREVSASLGRLFLPDYPLGWSLALTKVQTQIRRCRAEDLVNVHILGLIQQFVDTSTGCKMDLFKFEIFFYLIWSFTAQSTLLRSCWSSQLIYSNFC